jgi:hypothetical protein
VCSQLNVLYCTKHPVATFLYALCFSPTLSTQMFPAYSLPLPVSLATLRNVGTSFMACSPLGLDAFCDLACELVTVQGATVLLVRILGAAR